MSQRTVWLRRDPVGTHNLLPSRDEFRARNARRALLAGGLGVGALALLVILRALQWLDRVWNPLHAGAFCLGIAGIGAGAIALRTPRLRAKALTGVGVSLIAISGALFVDRLVDLVGR